MSGSQFTIMWRRLLLCKSLNIIKRLVETKIYGQDLALLTELNAAKGVRNEYLLLLEIVKITLEALNKQYQAYISNNLRLAFSSKNVERLEFNEIE